MPPLLLATPAPPSADLRSTTSTPTATTPTTATTTTTATATTTTTTTTSPLQYDLLHPPRPASRNKILCEFAQSQTLNSYGSWRFNTEEDDSKHLSNLYKSDPDASQPGSPISDSSSSVADSVGSPAAYDRDVLSARASRGTSSLGSSWGISSIGKSIDWWNTSDSTGGASDTEPTDDDDNNAEQQEEQQEEPTSQLRSGLVTRRGSGNDDDENDHHHRHERSSPLSVRSFGFHSIGSPLSHVETAAATTSASPNSILDLSPFKHYFAPNLNPLPRLALTMTAAASSALPSPSPRADILFPITTSPLSQSPVHSRPLSPYISPYLSRAPSSAGSTTSARFRRRSSQKRVSLIAGRVSFTPPPSPPPIDADHDHDHDAADEHRSPRLLRLNSTSSFVSLASTVATAPPTPAAGGAVGQGGDYIGERSISEFVIQGDVGRGAYGLVKRGREVLSSGSYGVSPGLSTFFFRLLSSVQLRSLRVYRLAPLGSP